MVSSIPKPFGDDDDATDTRTVTLGVAEPAGTSGVGMTWPPVPCGTSGVVHAVGTGSRAWCDRRAVGSAFDALRALYPLLTVVEGGAPGADAAIGMWAAHGRHDGVHWVRMPARWDEYPNRMRWRAGHDRNQAMLDFACRGRTRGDGVVLIAFKHELDGRLFGADPRTARGDTEDVIRRAWAANVPVWHVGDGVPTVVSAP